MIHLVTRAELCSLSELQAQLPAGFQPVHLDLFQFPGFRAYQATPPGDHASLRANAEEYQRPFDGFQGV